MKIYHNVKIFQLGTAPPSIHKFNFTLFIPISSDLLYKMKSTSSTATGTTTITIANITSKVAAFSFFLASLFGVVYSNSNVSLLQNNEYRLKLRLVYL